MTINAVVWMFLGFRPLDKQFFTLLYYLPLQLQFRVDIKFLFGLLVKSFIGSSDPKSKHPNHVGHSVTFCPPTVKPSNWGFILMLPWAWVAPL